LNRYLRANENIVWHAKPDWTSYVFRNILNPVAPFGIVWTALVFGTFSQVMSPGTPIFFLLFFIPFLVVGPLMIFGPCLSAVLSYGKIQYVITDQRIITQSGTIGVNTRFIELDKIQEVDVHIGAMDRLFGTGTVAVTTTAGLGYGYQTNSNYTQFPNRCSFAALKNPYQVHEILNEIMRKRATGF
jgi:uncharacterized membrane protein YdbT with pleckstrin-like domain